ncbi:MAG TPA: restriction endonuclease [Usitatibacteraceae bacterium]
MARKKTSPAEDFIELISYLPWWGGIALAVVSYLVFHWLGQPDPPVAVPLNQMPAQMMRVLWKVVANFAQYAVPVLCVIAAIVSVWRRHQRKGLVENVAQAKSTNALDGMSWREFEMLVGEAFRLNGFSVVETGGGGADGGVDLVLSKGSEKFLVQCKQWKAYRVGVDVVRELYGVMAASGATGGFVVTSGRFTEDAKAFAEGRNLQLLDGETLFAMIKQARRSIASGGSQGGQSKPLASMQRAAAPAAAVACPVCGSAMVKRVAGKGVNAGSAFWGCSRYPGCRGTRGG